MLSLQKALISLLLLSEIQFNGASAAKVKKAKTGEKDKSSKKGRVTCVKDGQHAAAIGSRMWGEMWHEFIETQCDCGDMADVWDHYVTDDVTVSILEPAMGVGIYYPGPSLTACTGREDCVEFLHPATCQNCAEKNFLSFSTHSGEVDEDDCMNFTVKMNEYITAPQNCGTEWPFATGRTYSFRMNENYVKGGDEPMAKLYFIQFNCPFDLHNTLVDCPAGIDDRIDPNYVVFDETPDSPGCIDLPAP
jgi:hypothetical protein